jgi:DNA-3-methyladenine glycosylase II
MLCGAMARLVLDKDNLAKAMRHLGKVDADFARVLKEVGVPELREMPTGFGGLMRSIVGQQVSVHAARSIDFEALHTLEDEAAIAMLCQAKGIGRWTAEIYLMFAHGRPDIMPGLDLGLVVAAQHLKRLRKRPDAKRLLKIAEPWRPWRSAAALLLWHYRRNMPDWSAKDVKAR